MSHFSKDSFPIISFFIILITGCQQGHINPEGFSDGLTGTMSTSELHINLNQKAQGFCLTDSSVDACIFLKNPVEQNQGPLSDHLDITDTLRSLQNYGVQINNSLVQVANLYTGQSQQLFGEEESHQNSNFQDENSIIKLEEVQVPGQNSIIIGLQPHGVSALTGTTDFPTKQRNFVDNNSHSSHRDALQSDEVFLQNNSYDVGIDYKGMERATRRDDGSWRFEYGNSDHSVVQVMTYYYLMHQMDWMRENAGGWYALNKNINVIALDEEVKNNAYWNPLENTISLGFVCDSNLPFQILKNITCDFKMEIGLSAEITLHEAAHANFYYSKNTQNAGSEAFCEYHTNCEGKSICQGDGDEEASICCNDTKGCFFAIDEGQADFHASVIFPESPQIGEAIANDMNGLNCPSDSSIYRDPEANADQVADQLFYQCYQSMHGQIHGMGMLYSSIWWSVYTHSSVNQQEIMSLFTNHLPLVSLDDNFETAGQRVLNLDQLLYNGRYSDIITNEFQKRGLTPQANVVNF